MNTLIHRSAPWLLAALMGGTGIAAWAQTAPPAAAHPPAAAQAGERPMQHGPMMERMKARHEQHLRQLKAKLQLKPEQEPAWTAFAGAMTPPTPPAARPDWTEVLRLNTPERIDRMKALRQQHQNEMNAQMDRRGEVAKTFYAALSAEQRKVFDDETRQHMAQWGGHGRGEHHGRHGRS
ncbi:MAG: Spy/CpxP family protein refolding chaperone [Betaproteobacteria bacterium]